MQRSAHSPDRPHGRVAFVVGSEATGGGERFLLDLCEQLIPASGLEAVIIGDLSVEFSEQVPRRRPWFGSKKWSRKQRFQTILPSPLYLLSVVWLVAREHRSRRITAFHLQYKREQVMLTWLLSLIAPVIWTEHGRIPRGRLVRASYRFAAVRAKCIVAVSEPVAESVRAVVHDQTRVTVIRNGVDADFFRPPTKAERAAARDQLGISGPTVAVISSRLEPAKRLDWVPDLCASQGVELLVMGDGTDQARLEKRSATVGAIAHFLGRVEERDQVRTGYWCADLSCHGQDEGEGLPLALLEATACGCVPVALSEHDLVSAFVTEASGITVSPAGLASLPLLGERHELARAWAEAHNIRLVARAYERVLRDADRWTAPGAER